MLLKLRLELLMLLLEQVDSTKTHAHHVGSHHVWKHIWEAEGRHLVVMTTSSSTELLETLELSLSLGKIGSESSAVALNTSDTPI